MNTYIKQVGKITLTVHERDRSKNSNIPFSQRFYCTIAENSGTYTNIVYLEESELEVLMGMFKTLKGDAA